MFKNKKQLTSDDLSLIIKNIEIYLFPIGVIPIEAIEANSLYERDTIIENLEYFNSITSIIFKDIYSIEEINIINAYLIIQSYSQTFLTSEMEKLILLFINKTSNKKEIQYCIDELKFNYLKKLIYTNSSQQELINKLITELEVIEQDHNAIEISQLRILPL